MGLNSREIGAALGVSHTAVNRAARRGRIPREADGSFDLEKVKAVWVENADQHQRAKGLKSKAKADVAGGRGTIKATAVEPKLDVVGPDASEPVETLNNAQRRKESAMADLKEIEVKKKAGELLPTEEVAQQWTRIISSARNGLLLVPSKVAPKVAMMTDVRECQAAIDKEIRAALSQLVEDPDGNDELAA